MLNIKIDGDKFALTYPLLSDWTDTFAGAVANLPEWKTDSWTFLNEAKRVGSFIKMGKTHFSVDDDPIVEKQVFQANDFGDMGWRPVLIPEIPIDDPNGTLMLGGSLYCKDQAMKVQEAPYRLTAIKAYRKVELSDLSIGDTVYGKELSWVVWHGALICTKVMITHITGRELYRFLSGEEK